MLVVVGIIAILAAIFLNQRKSGVRASVVETDLRNAATMMQSEYADTGRFTTAVPDYSQFSEGNLVSVVPGASNLQEFCLRGTNEAIDETMYWSTTDESFVDSCANVSSGQSFGTLNSGKKVLLVERGTGNSNYIRDVLTLQGYISSNISIIQSGTLTSAQTAGFDLLVITSQYWAANGSDLAVAYSFYDAGGDVFVEGNDTRPNRFGDTVHVPSGGIGFKPNL